MTRPKPRKASLAKDLVQFYDEFAEFHDYCAFLCDAVACLAADEDGLDPSTRMGVQRYSQWLKQRVQELKQELRRIQEKSVEPKRRHRVGPVLKAHDGA